MKEISYLELKGNLGAQLRHVANDRVSLTVRTMAGKRVALIPADELTGLIETLHLLRSPKNAQRLIQALSRVKHVRGVSS
jgi:antitoxin YefM